MEEQGANGELTADAQEPGEESTLRGLEAGRASSGDARDPT